MEDSTFLEVLGLRESDEMNNLQKSCEIISVELKKHGDFYRAFVASVKSALIDGIQLTTEDSIDKKTEDIVRRIAGEEWEDE